MRNAIINSNPVIADGDVESWMINQARKGRRAQRRRSRRHLERRKVLVGGMAEHKEFSRPGATRRRGQDPSRPGYSAVEWKGVRDRRIRDDEAFSFWASVYETEGHSGYDWSDPWSDSVMEEMLQLENEYVLLEVYRRQDDFLASHFPDKGALADFCEYNPFGCGDCLVNFARWYPEIFALALKEGVLAEAMQ